MAKNTVMEELQQIVKDLATTMQEKAVAAGVPCVPFSGAGTDYCYASLVACDSSSVTRIGGTP